MRIRSILERERIITLSSASAKAVFDVMENPPEPSERLKRAMKRREKESLLAAN